MQNEVIIIIIKEVIVDAFPNSQVRLSMVHTKFSKLTHEAGIGNGQPTPVSLPGEFYGERSLVGYSPWGSQRVGHNWVTEHGYTHSWGTLRMLALHEVLSTACVGTDQKTAEKATLQNNFRCTDTLLISSIYNWSIL